MKIQLKHIFIVNLFILTLGGFAFGQDSQGGGSSGVHQIGVFTGKILPKGIDGASEIFSLSGLRYSMPMNKTNYLDMGTILGNGQGVSWKGLFVGLSMHIPVETLIGHAGIGVDLTRYESDTTAVKNIGGGHFIGGIMSKLGDETLVRFDMKLSSKPGTSLFFGIGLVYGFGGAGR